MNPWLAAIRPETLSLSVTPVIAGSALAFAVAGLFRWDLFVVTLVVALLVQLGANLYGGEPRGLAAETARPVAMRCFALAFILGIYPAVVGGWPIVAVGLASLAAGWAYNGGQRPIAHTPFGELFAFLFSGITAVMGSFCLQVGAGAPVAWIAAIALGLHAVALLLVDHCRDLEPEQEPEQEQRAGRRTLPVRLSGDAGRSLFGLLVGTPFVLVAVLVWMGLYGAATVAILIPVSRRLVMRFREAPAGPGIDEIRVATAKLQALFGLLMAVGVVWVALG